MYHFNITSIDIVAVGQSLNCVWFFVTTQTAACQASLSFTISQSLLRFMSIESLMPSNHLILCRPLSSCPQSFPASESFPVSWLFESGSQSIGASASILLMNIQDWFPLGLTALISLQSRGLSRVFSNYPFHKSPYSFLMLTLLLTVSFSLYTFSWVILESQNHVFFYSLIISL